MDFSNLSCMMRKFEPIKETTINITGSIQKAEFGFAAVTDTGIQYPINSIEAKEGDTFRSLTITTLREMKEVAFAQFESDVNGQILNRITAYK